MYNEIFLQVPQHIMEQVKGSELTCYGPAEF